MDSVKDLCSRDVKIQEGDSALLQRSTTQLLENASTNDIPVSCLHLEYSSIKFEGDTLILSSGIPLPILPTVEKIHIAGSNTPNGNTGTLTDNDILNLFRYGMKCGHVKELMFDQFQLSTFSSSEAFKYIMKTKKFQVRWRPFDIEFHLDLQNGHWEVDDIQVILNENSGTVSLSGRNNILQHMSTLQLLEVARNHDIPISCLNLNESFSKIDAGDVILHSGLRLSCPVSVKKVVIHTEEGREMTETEFLDILMCVHQSHMLKELWFDGCLLPPNFDEKTIPEELNARDITVFWKDYGYKLNLQSGVWEVYDVNTVRKLCTGMVEILADGSDLLQECTIKLTEIASDHDIPISCLYLKDCYSMMASDVEINLCPDLYLACPVSVKKIVIDTWEELQEADFEALLSFVRESHLLEELEFKSCRLPQSIPAESIPSILKSRNVKVSWEIGSLLCTLNLQSGRWMHRETRKEITDTEYYDAMIWYQTTHGFSDRDG